MHNKACRCSILDFDFGEKNHMQKIAGTGALQLDLAYRMRGVCVGMRRWRDKCTGMTE
ncbi:hypothetical protein F2P79_015375 [Pimephales promelas]|nr:hypothetical protein F2P79_015375 [Pimephales promelas]